MMWSSTQRAMNLVTLADEDGMTFRSQVMNHVSNFRTYWDDLGEAPAAPAGCIMRPMGASEIDNPGNCFT